MTIFPEFEDELRTLARRSSTAAPVRRAPRGLRFPRWARAMRAFPILASVAVVIAVVVVAVGAGGTHRTAAPATSAATHRIVLRAESQSRPGPHVTAAAMRSEIALLREHLNALGIAGSTSVRQIGRDEIAVAYHRAHPLDFPTIARLVSTQIAFADWEDNLIAPDGRTVASQLPGGGPGVVRLSQGGATGAGVAGATRLYDAVRVASHQPVQPISSRPSRLGSQYFAFTQSGGYLAGPTLTRGELKAPHAAVILAVPQGTLVVQARAQSPIGAAQYQNAHARFFVLRDHVDVFSSQQLKHITASEHRGLSTLNLGFTSRGRRAFRQLTAVVAHRGTSLGQSNDPFLQHVAVIENGALLSVAQIDYRLYPEGIDPATTGIPTAVPAATTRSVTRQLTQSLLSLDLQVISR
jgi:hypothetical protein